MANRTGGEYRKPFDARIVFRPQDLKAPSANDPIPDNSLPNPFGTKPYPNLQPQPVAKPPVAPSTEQYKFYPDKEKKKVKPAPSGPNKPPPDDPNKKTKTGGGKEWKPRKNDDSSFNYSNKNKKGKDDYGY